MLVAIAILACGVLVAAFLTAQRTEHPVGFQIARATDSDGRPFAVGVWYPTEARPWPTTLMGPVLMNVARDGPISGRDLPLVVISHGNGGGPQATRTWPLPLPSAGYVVAAPMHAGDNYADQSAVGSASFCTAGAPDNSTPPSTTCSGTGKGTTASTRNVSARSESLRADSPY